MSLLAAPLGGCLSKSQGAVPGAQGALLHVATTRVPVGDGTKSPFLGTARTATLRYARARAPQPETGLALSSIVGSAPIASFELVEGDAATALAEGLRGQNSLLYVHGYNQTFESAAADGLALSSGIGFRGNNIVFSWPSKGGLLDYVGDREAAMLSRDALADALSAVLSDRFGARIHLVAHSMGTLLLLEALRTYRDRHGANGIDRVGAIVLASPDIDLDVFKANLARLGPLRDKITVITATNDRALELSRRLAGGVRVGALPSGVLEGLGVRVVDATEFASGLVRHDAFLSNDDVRAVIRRAVERS